MIAEEIVQKVGTTYTLYTPWVVQFQALAARLAATAFSDRDGMAALLRQQKRQRWHFDSLLAMNDLWGHLFLYISRHARRKDILTWNPHLWFNLFQKERETKFLKSMRVTGCRMHVIVGGTGFLDRWATDVFDDSGVSYATRRSPYHGDTRTYFNVIDDHILTVKLDAATDRRLEEAYRVTTSAEQFFASDLISVFMREGHCTLSLDYNPRKAEKIRRIFSDYFGTFR